MLISNLPVALIFSPTQIVYCWTISTILHDKKWSLFRFIAVTAGQLEQISRGNQGLTFLQCIKCQSKFSQDNLQNRSRKKTLEVINFKFVIVTFWRNFAYRELKCPSPPPLYLILGESVFFLFLNLILS